MMSRRPTIQRTMMAKKPKPPRSMAADIIGVIREGTKKWTKTVKAEERSPASRSYRCARMTRERGISFKEAAAQIMESAYLKVSGNDTLPANARQIMYAARPHIQKVTGRELHDSYFTQTLLPDYLTETGVDWDVVYDARGHFNEPHDGRSFGIGTLEVRQYLAGLHDPELVEAALAQAKVDTCGPRELTVNTLTLVRITDRWKAAAKETTLHTKYYFSARPEDPASRRAGRTTQAVGFGGVVPPSDNDTKRQERPRLESRDRLTPAQPHQWAACRIRIGEATPGSIPARKAHFAPETGAK